MTLSAARARAIVARFPRLRVVVAGDLIADEFIYGRIARVSREAPVLILEYDATEVLPGGAGNAANNAGALGASVEVVGVVGRDAIGGRVTDALAKRARVGGVVRSGRYATPVKTRILAGGVHSAKQQVVRIDRPPAVVAPAVRRTVEAALARAIARVDVLIVSDYGTGLITPGVWDRACEAAAVKKRPLVFVDSRYALTRFSGMTACTPNEPEVEHLLGTTIGEHPAALEQAGRALLETLRSDAVLITRGSRGMALFEPGRATDHIPIVGSDEIADVTGAGDTVIAVFSLAVAAGASFAEAARLANHAGGLVVMKRGTATVTAEELVAAVAREGQRAKGKGQRSGAN